MRLLLSLLCAYLLGSIPFGYLLYRSRRGADIRATGSGGIGATNVYRAAGPSIAAATLLCDGAKGYIAVLIAARLSSHAPMDLAVAALAVMAGHCFPVFLNFRGGKGVATGLGAFGAISAIAVSLAVAVFALMLAASRYVSLASMTAAAAFPLILLARGQAAPPVIAAAFAAAALILARHRGNLQRLRAGTESKLFGR